MQIRFWLFVFTSCFLVSAPGHAATRDANGKLTLNDAELGTLHKAVCAVGPSKDDKGQWTCDRAKNYPDRRGGRDCDLSFERGGIYAGLFTGNRTQWLAAYVSGCESRASRDGGAALFDVTPDGSKLVRYFPGKRYDSCIATAGVIERNQLYCTVFDSGAGVRFLSFGTWSFSDDGSEIKEDLWLTLADNFSTITSCRRAGAKAGSGPTPITIDPYDSGSPGLVSLNRKGDKFIVALEYKMVTPAALTKACARLAAGKFIGGEMTSREARRLAKDQVELHDDEVTIKPVWLVFTPPSRKPKLSLTKP